MKLRDMVIEAILDMELEEAVELLLPIYNDRDGDGIFPNDEEGYQFIIDVIGLEDFVYHIAGCGDKVRRAEFIRLCTNGYMYIETLSYQDVYELLIDILIDDNHSDFELEQMAEELGLEIESADL